MLRLPWVSRRAYDLALEALHEAQADTRAMRESIAHLVDRNTGLTDPWVLFQARIAERERREGLLPGEAGVSGKAKEKRPENVVGRL
jgi:hypothetical protein